MMMRIIRSAAASRRILYSTSAKASAATADPTLAQYYGVTAQCAFASALSPPAPRIPAFRMLPIQMEQVEQPAALDVHPQLASYDAAWGRRMLETMLLMRALDQIMYDAQRQGRISFYMTSLGEEAAVLGAAAALNDDDVIFAQYREAGALLYRGYSLDAMMNQCFSNVLDSAKARQMPIHYGSRELHYHTISSPLATQLPHAAGAAYALKMQRKSKSKSKSSEHDAPSRVVLCYFGDGAASEGDFHAAMNIAATRAAPVVFFCRNNGYAISTHVDEQYRGDGVAGRGAGYGVPTLRVDGNDVYAVHHAVSVACARAREPNNETPVLVEAMTYRSGHHSTSDDASAYRARNEGAAWAQGNCPVGRLRAHLERVGQWDDGEHARVQGEARQRVLQALERAERVERVRGVEGIADDVYDKVTEAQKRQVAELSDVVRRYASMFP